MMRRFKLKLTNGELRRFSLPQESNIASLKSKISCITGLTSFSLHYEDEDGDQIVIETDDELMDALAGTNEDTAMRLSAISKPISDAPSTDQVTPPTPSVEPLPVEEPTAYVKIPSPNSPVMVPSAEPSRPTNPLLLLGKMFHLLAPLHRPSDSSLLVELLPKLTSAITAAVLRPETCDFDVSECVIQLSTHGDAILTQAACDTDQCDAIYVLCRNFVSDSETGNPAALSLLIRAVISQLADIIPEDALNRIVDRGRHSLSVSEMSESDVLPARLNILHSIASSSMSDSFHSTQSRDMSQYPVVAQSFSHAPTVVTCPPPTMPPAQATVPPPTTFVQDFQSVPSSYVARAPDRVQGFHTASFATPPTHPPPENPAFSGTLYGFTQSAPSSTVAPGPVPARESTIFRPQPTPSPSLMTESLTLAVSDYEVLSLKELADMGFTDVSLNRELLHRFSNDVNSVVNALLGMY